MKGRHQALKALRFHDLTPYRIREVLLVSSAYDAFILEEDGQLTEQVFFEYREVNASGPPRFTHVATAREAFAALAERRFDLILVMTSFSGMGVNAFARSVKELRPGRPVVFLALEDQQIEEARKAIDPKAIDGAFLWSGDAHILFAIIKYIEDLSNVGHDTREGNVRVIIMIEDSPRYYSAFLALLYRELLTQSRSLSSEGVNELHRLMYMRSRPKILHATSYEDGIELLHRFSDKVMAVISDVAIPRDGHVDDTAGLDFSRLARKIDPELPVLLQSADPGNAELAEGIEAGFANKNSPTLLSEIRTFLTERLGFGDFVFRLPDGTEVGRARDLREMEEVLKTIPEESLAHHASHNHFSIWLMARSEFDLATLLRPRQPEDFGGVEEMREHLVSVLREARRSSYRGHIADLSPQRFEHDLISRTGQGALGGKARGIAFINRYLTEIDPKLQKDLPISVPKTAVITTDMYDEFLDGNDLREFALDCTDETKIARRFIAAPLPGKMIEDLDFLISRLDGPLAVRSSSLLEDSLHQPFAGVYSTLMIPNSDAERRARLEQLSNAVKLVYASTFSSNARSYLHTTGHLQEEEKMAVIIQRVIGRHHGQRFYPTFSGVAQSFNYYPVGPQEGDDGIVHVALGLGRLVVDGGLALRFSPRHPEILPQFATPKAMLDGSQRTFYALDMEHPCCEADIDPLANVREFDLATAEKDGTLFTVGSVYCREDGQLREDFRVAGPRVVNFSNILKHGAIPLADALSAVITIARQALAGSVEIEFACEMGDWGQLTARPGERLDPHLYILQMRPLGTQSLQSEIGRHEYSWGEILCASTRSLGHGVERNVRDIVYVRRDRWQAAHNKRIGREIDRLNEKLAKESRQYLLIGPGRWGTADEWLGIPVQWRQISKARVIVEASPRGYAVEPSQGTHFFQNITSLRVGYITLPPAAEKPGEDDGTTEYLDWDWLDAQPAHRETEHLRHIRLDGTLTVILDGVDGRGLILKPGTSNG
jgi:DNA-binding NarL/FixJ family response regulator